MSLHDQKCDIPLRPTGILQFSDTLSIALETILISLALCNVEESDRVPSSNGLENTT